MTCVFKLTPLLKAIIAHTVAHTGTCKVAYMDEIDKDDSLWLVKDEGAYLMASTTPRLQRIDKPNRAFVVYAEGMTPDDGHIGGDDFVENIPLKWFTDAIKRKATLFIVTLTSKSMEFDSK